VTGQYVNPHDLPRLVVMISGNGSNLQALIDACAAGWLRAQIALVVSNRKTAYGLTRAEQAGIPALHFPASFYPVREEYDRALAEVISPYQPSLVVLAGWMHILSSPFLDRFPNRIINLHPALPGKYPGARAIERAFESFMFNEIEESGCMVHHVEPEVDAGHVVAKATVPMVWDDTLESFTARMHATEHQLLVYAVRALLSQQEAAE
jgi:formyltetrahydrofolate-dependent phosphoribosylglycinamide formyltransferase